MYAAVSNLNQLEEVFQHVLHYGKDTPSASISDERGSDTDSRVPIINEGRKDLYEKCPFRFADLGLH